MTHMMVILCYATGAMSLDTTTSTNPAAWIAVLRDRERVHGRDAWSFQELSDARSAVFDAQYVVPAGPTWLHTVYQHYLEWYPALLLVIMIAGIWSIWNVSKARTWIRSLTVLLGWLVILWLAQLPMRADPNPAAVIKMHGITLRQGNGLSYPYTLRQNEPVSLAAGVEARLLAERTNGWVYILLPDGVRGWVPRDAVYLVGW